MKRREGLELETDADNNSTRTNKSSTPTPELSDSVSSSYVRVPTTATLPNRFVHATEPTSILDEKIKDLMPCALINHPGPKISALATEYLEIESEFVSSWSGTRALA